MKLLVVGLLVKCTQNFWSGGKGIICPIETLESVAWTKCWRAVCNQNETECFGEGWWGGGGGHGNRTPQNWRGGSWPGLEPFISHYEMRRLKRPKNLRPLIRFQVTWLRVTAARRPLPGGSLNNNFFVSRRTAPKDLPLGRCLITNRSRPPTASG